MRWIAVMLIVLASACGASRPTTPVRTGPDVVTADWDAADDARLGV